MGEFAIAYDEDKVTGVLTGTGGITDHLDTILALVSKKIGAIVSYHSNPETLLDELE